MCGIVGYWGPQKPKKIIIDGLRRLEYRGYDSTGIAVFDGAHLEVFRAPGKLTNLETKVGKTEFSGPTGIGHTRWATHGEPNERNAHPHKVGATAIVHNGIIENYREIKEDLVKRGVTIKSETDSELIAHLIEIELTSGKKGDLNLLSATVNVIRKLKGAYSILVINEHEPDTLLAFKNGTPMIVGLGKGETLIASDVQALVEHTKRIVYLEDGEIVLSQKGKVTFYNAEGKSIEKKVVEINWTSALAEKQGFDHFMQKEIFEQPRALIQTMEPHIQHNPLRVKLKDVGFTDAEFKKFERVQIIACGTSWHAGLVAKYVFERLAKIPCDIDIASEFRYREPVMNPKTLVVTISQSGETADTLACLRQCKKMGLKALSICNVPHSTIDREADGHLYTNAGPEIGVASTKAFTSQIVALELLALYMSELRGTITEKELAKYIEALLALPSQVEVCLNHDKWFKEAAQTLSGFKGFLYLGRGINYPVALEGALKLKEITYLHAEGYPSGELKHGPIALIDKEMAIIALAPHDDLYEKNISNIEEVRARGGQLILIGTGQDQALIKLARFYLGLPEGAWTTYPVLAAIPVQLMSYHLAVNLKRDVDQPRNLAKSVTVE